MALEIKKITIPQEEEGEISTTTPQDPEWSGFCRKQLKVFETKWTKKLEDYDSSSKKKKGGKGSKHDEWEDDDEDEEEVEDDEDDEEEAEQGFKSKKKVTAEKKRPGSGRYGSNDNDDEQKTDEEKEEEESNLEQLLSGPFNKNLNAHRNKVHIKASKEDPRKSLEEKEDEVQDPEAQAEAAEGEAEAETKVEENANHHIHHEGPFFNNQFWSMPDIIDTKLEDLLKEEGYYQD